MARLIHAWEHGSMRFAAIVLAFVAMSAAARAPAACGSPPGLPAVIARITPSVALVETWRQDGPSPLLRDPAFAQFLGTDRAEPKERAEAGTAFVVDAAAGLLVTTDYVVRDAHRVEVTLASGERRIATVVGQDEASGVGLLRIGAEGLAALEWSDAEPAVGDSAVLVAFVFKKGPIATAGIVSGRDHVVDGFGIPALFIDVAVSRGAAGGAVTTAEGRVIAMAYGSYGTGGDPYASLGVAVPASEMRPVIEALARDGKVRRSWIGIMVGPASLRRGARVLEVTDGSPAARAGIRKDDEIFAIDGQTMHNDLPLRRAVARAPVGATLAFKVRGKDDEEREVSVVTELRPD
ncbi:MAG: S1C family serine protease [Gammaproteobacteria bacterium]